MKEKIKTLGRPMLYGEKTTTISIKVPKSKKEYYKKSFDTFLKVNENVKCNNNVTK